MARVFKIAGRDGRKLAHWYGKVRVADNKRIRVKLFTDKAASERRLVELQRESDQRIAGVRTVVMDYASVSIEQHATDYIAALRLEKLDSDTVRIAEWSLDRMVEWGKWRIISDLTADSMRNILTTLDRQGKTASYLNKFIMRAKAFVHWLQREGRILGDPLANLKRIDERNGKRTRARRALTDNEVSALLEESPLDRREKYAWALLAGMRRSELKKLRWGDLRLNAPRPFIQLRPEQTKNGKADILPIHPYLLKLIRQRAEGLPEIPVVSSVPDMKTMVKDLTKAGVSLTDTRDRRADFHALRHTFCTNLDRTGCSFTTKRALMRHADSSVTEGYSHARLDELYAAIERLPSPLDDPEQQYEQQGEAVKTGTDDLPVPTFSAADVRVSIDADVVVAMPDESDNNVRFLDHLLDQSSFIDGHSSAFIGNETKIDGVACDDAASRYNLVRDIDLHSLAFNGINNECNSLIDSKLRPSTQVD